eukprot:scaffold360_cov374-Pavlova_lutheri.AAC.11
MAFVAAVTGCPLAHPLALGRARGEKYAARPWSILLLACKDVPDAWALTLQEVGTFTPVRTDWCSVKRFSMGTAFHAMPTTCSHKASPHFRVSTSPASVNDLPFGFCCSFLALSWLLMVLNIGFASI